MKLKISENQIKKDTIKILTFLKIPSFRLNSVAMESEYKGKKRFMKMTFAGCPDICALLPNGETLWIKLKSKTRKMRPDQIAFQELCKARNVPHLVARSSDEVHVWLINYGVVP